MVKQIQRSNERRTTMGLKRLIHKIKDYDRLERDYCVVLDMISDGAISKPNYSTTTIEKVFNDYLKQRDCKFLNAISDEIGKLYEKYEGEPLIEGGLLDGFVDVINDYYEEQSLM